MRVNSLVIMLLSTASAPAAFVTYNFEPPNFIVGTTTPLLNVAPNIGDPSFPSFMASFTCAPAPGGIGIFNFQPNALFFGQSLGVPTLLGQSLTITTSESITAVTLDFATIVPSQLIFTSSAGNLLLPSLPLPSGGFAGGTLNFSSATPFTSFTLNTGAGDLFGIDNLSITPQGTLVPMPPTLYAGSLGLALLGLRRFLCR